MVSTQETVTFDVTVDGRGAAKGLADVDRALTSTEGFAKRLWTSLNTVEGKTVSLGDQAKMLQQKLGPAAAAISGVSAALGESAGQAGKVVAATGQLVAAYGAGGPFGVALAAGTIAVDQLTKAMARWNDEEDRAIKLRFAGVDAAAATRKDVAERIKTLRETITAESGGSKGQSITEIRERYDAEIKPQQTIIDQLRQRTNLHDDLTDQEYAQQKILEESVRKLREARDLEITLYKLRRDGNKSEPKSTGSSSSSGGGSAEQLRAYLAAKGGNLASDAENANAAFLASVAGLSVSGGVVGSGGPMTGRGANASPFKAAASGLDELTQAMEVNKAIASDWGLALSKAFGGLADGATVAQQATQIVVGSSQALLDDFITGQDHALEAFTASIMAQAGQALVSYGVQAIGRGVLEASSPITAVLAPASFAAGAALIGSGVALGGISTGIGHVAAGGTIGQKLPNQAARTSTGVNRGSGGQRSGGASAINVTVIYAGASGPTAEQGARAVVEATARAGRRGIK